MRAVDLHSRHLFEDHGLTAPQLAALRAVETHGPLSPAAIAQRIHLSRPTVTGILARLCSRGMLVRTPCPSDGRSVWIELTVSGRQALAAMPPVLQETFVHRLAELADWERSSILATLQRLASMMDASDLDAAPLLVNHAPDTVPPNTNGTNDQSFPTEHSNAG